MPAGALSASTLDLESRINFRTDGSWSADDVLRFVNAVSTIYMVLSLANEAEQQWNKILKRELDKTRLQILVFGEFRSGKSTLTNSLFTHTALMVSRISVNSPGLFSFDGIGEVIRQFRLLIRDVWFVNSQKRREGELRLKLLRKKVAALNALAYLDDDKKKRLVTIIVRSVNTLEEMEDSGLLKNVPEFIDKQLALPGDEEFGNDH